MNTCGVEHDGPCQPEVKCEAAFMALVRSCGADAKWHRDMERMASEGKQSSKEREALLKTVVELAKVAEKDFEDLEAKLKASECQVESLTKERDHFKVRYENACAGNKTQREEFQKCKAELALWKEGKAGCTALVKNLEGQIEMLVAKSDMYSGEVKDLEAQVESLKATALAACQAAYKQGVSESECQLDALIPLAQKAMENFDDDLEERPMRHEIGSLYARLRTAIEKHNTSKGVI